MTGTQDRPDVQQRRRLDRLRSGLGLKSVPPVVGTELRTMAPMISKQLERRLLDRASRHPEPAASEHKQLHAPVLLALAEFARIVEDRPPGDPAAEVVLGELVRGSQHPERSLTALSTALDTVREAMRDLWGRLPHGQAHATQLDVGLARYTERLCTRTVEAQLRQAAGSQGRRHTQEARMTELLAMVDHRWGSDPVPLCLGVSAVDATRDAAPSVAGRRPRRSRTPAPANDPTPERPMRLVAADHVVTTTPHADHVARSAGTRRSPLGLCVGPVLADDLAMAYDSALLLFRLVRIGVAQAPPPSTHFGLPHLGFLHPYPSHANVRKVADLLLPLCAQPCVRRVSLARTLQFRLRTSGTAQSLAKQLEMHPQTLHNHLAALRELYDPELEFDGDTVAIQAALDLVLPLWELEAAASQASRSGPHGRR